MLAVGLGHYLVVSALLLVLGVFGIFLNRKNVIVILMSVELMINSINLLLAAFSAYSNDPAGQIFVFFIMVVAAAEVAIGLAIIVLIFKTTGSIDIDVLNKLKW